MHGLAQHSVLPGHEVARSSIVEGETIDALLTREDWSFRLPTICVVNGKPVLRTEWQRMTLRADDTVQFWSKPLGGQGGGSGKNVFGLVAIIALAAFAPWAGGMLASALIPAGAAGFAGFSLVSSAFAGVIMAPGGSLVNLPLKRREQ